MEEIYGSFENDAGAALGKMVAANHTGLFPYNGKFHFSLVLAVFQVLSSHPQASAGADVKSFHRHTTFS